MFSLQEISPLTQFSKARGNADGLQNLCKNCSNFFKKIHYKENKSDYQKRRDKKRALNRKTIQVMKEISPCRDCNKVFPYYIMHFDHMRDKVSNIARRVGNNRSLEEVLDEIKKCHIVCANCHSARSYKRGYYSDGFVRGNNPSKAALAAREKRKTNREILHKLKEKNPCIDCKNYYPYYVMSYDHLKDKKFDISRGASEKTLKALLSEIGKCELVCHNCHATRTHKRNNPA